MYGVNGKVTAELAAVYDPAAGVQPGMVLTPTATYQYVGIRKVGWNEPVEDRLGTKPAGSGRPYGENVSQYATHQKDATGLHYADQRYYQASWGRFTTPDPYVPSALPGDPGSWNRYAYVQGDPVNYLDPSGEASIEAGAPWWTKIPPVFVVNVFLAIFRTTTIRHVGWQTDVEVGQRVAAREKAFWKDHENDDEDNIQSPMFLKVVDDCFKKQLFGGALVRRRRYQVLDEYQRPMENPGAVRVEERHDIRFAPKGFVTGGAWGQGTRNPLNGDAMFDDLISTGSDGDFWTYQSFTGSAPGNVSRPLAVLEAGNIWTTLGIHATPKQIDMNGPTPTKICDTPDI
jgi:RHS repeat-associated protein